MDLLEIIIVIAMIVLMARIASADDQSPWLWGGLTFALCAAAIVLIPLPIIRLAIVGGVVFIAMIVYKVMKDR